MSRFSGTMTLNSLVKMGRGGYFCLQIVSLRNIDQIYAAVLFFEKSANFFQKYLEDNKKRHIFAPAFEMIAKVD